MQYNVIVAAGHVFFLLHQTEKKDELMHECFLKHSRMGKQEWKKKKKQKKKVRRKA